MKRFLQRIWLILVLPAMLSAQVTSISDIVTNFSTYNGTSVTITGILINDFGNLQTSRTNIYIVDNSGRGINVNSSTLYNSLLRGDSVTITGTISAFNDVYQIGPSSAPTVHSSGNAIPAPLSVTTNEVDDITYHSDYVEVVGVISDRDATVGSSGINFEVDDGSGACVIRVWNSTGLSIDSLAVGDSVRVRGGISTFSNAGQVLPSVASDILVLASGNGGGGNGGGNADDNPTIDEIVTDFSTYNGQTVTISGILLNDFGAIQSTRTNIYMVSPSGRAINLNSFNTYTNLLRGDSVTVTGEIGEFNDVIQIDPDGAPTVNSSGNPIPDPIPASTKDVNDIVYRGDYVVVTGQVTDVYETGSTGGNIEIDDGSGGTVVRVWATTGLMATQLAEIGKVYTIRGATGTFSGAGQIIISVESDVVEGVVGGDDLNPNAEIYLDVPSQVYDVKGMTDVTFNLKAPQQAQIDLKIYNFSGRVVKAFQTRTGSGLSQLVRWDKTNDNFQKVRLGTYILIMEVVESNGRKTRKMVPIVIGTEL